MADNKRTNNTTVYLLIVALAVIAAISLCHAVRAEAQQQHLPYDCTYGMAIDEAHQELARLRDDSRNNRCMLDIIKWDLEIAEINMHRPTLMAWICQEFNIVFLLRSVPHENGGCSPQN